MNEHIGRRLKYGAIAAGLGAGYGALKGMLSSDQNYSNGYGGHYSSLAIADNMFKGAVTGLTLGTIGGSIPGFYKGIDRGMARSLDAKPFTNLFDDIGENGAQYAAANQALKGMEYGQRVYDRMSRAGANGFMSSVSATGYTAGEAIGSSIGGAFNGILESSSRGYSAVRNMFNSPTTGIDMTGTALYSSALGANATLGNKAIGLMGAGAFALGATAISANAGFQSSASGAGIGHPANAANYFLGGGRIEEQYGRNKREQMRSEGAMLSSPYNVGLRDVDSAYGYNTSLRPSSMPTTRGQRKKAGINPGQFGDTGNLVFGLHNMR
jgi:hypothetical protein